MVDGVNALETIAGLNAVVVKIESVRDDLKDIEVKAGKARVGYLDKAKQSGDLNYYEAARIFDCIAHDIGLMTDRLALHITAYNELLGGIKE